MEFIRGKNNYQTKTKYLGFILLVPVVILAKSIYDNSTSEAIRPLGIATLLFSILIINLARRTRIKSQTIGKIEINSKEIRIKDDVFIINSEHIATIELWQNFMTRKYNTECHNDGVASLILNQKNGDQISFSFINNSKTKYEYLQHVLKNGIIKEL